MASEWLVVKLGGTSVARRDYWENIAARIEEALAARRRVLVVHSALAGTTDRLVELIAASDDGRRRILDELTNRHRALARELGVVEHVRLDARLAELRAVAMVLPALWEIEPPERARLLAMGECLLTALALPFLRDRGLPVAGVDARELLTVDTRAGAHPAAHFLAATCEPTPDPEFRRRLCSLSSVILTQGFFARDEEGRTVLLGRGGSDVSAACLAARLGLAELEIWTDVPGLFSADPNRLASARLLRELDYDEALEIAANGGRVLHPRCIPPLRRAAIPLRIRYTPNPDVTDTRIFSFSSPLKGESWGEGDQLVAPLRGATPHPNLLPQGEKGQESAIDPLKLSAENAERRPVQRDGLKAVCLRRHIAIITVDTLEMWQRAGFLADVFACFKARDLSVDMIATSETRVTLSLDQAVNPDIERRLRALREDLTGMARVEVKTDCAAVSLVGRRLRANLEEIAPLLEVFEGRRVHLMSQASNDLNLSFVVDDGDASSLVEALHEAFLARAVEGNPFGPSWKALTGSKSPRSTAPPWWQKRRGELLELGQAQSPRYVYDAATIRARAEALCGGGIADRIFYAVKANDHPAVLRVLYDSGLGFECVSRDELEYLFHLFPELPCRRVLFTPNFAPHPEYSAAVERGVYVTLDGLYPLRAWPELFAGREVLLRVDLGDGRGHHRHVRTAGRGSKFGIPVAQLGEARALADKNAIRVIGLHAHAGSGIMDAAHWGRRARRLAQLADDFPDVRILNLGGGLGIPRSREDSPVDVDALAESVAQVRATRAGVETWLEPGRFLVAEAGVLLTRVTQLKGKDGMRYLGVDTGMNSLIRPALYGAWHPIVNLSRLGDPSGERYTVVGPLCESGDVLGRDRLLPTTEEGDVLLIANAGAYGRVMSSHYNRRAPAGEFLLGCSASDQVNRCEGEMACN